jgi:hypothetical protein
MSNAINGQGVAWGKVGLAVAGAVTVGFGIYSLTHGTAELTKPAERVRTVAQTQQIVPTYGKPATAETSGAMLQPKLPGGTGGTGQRGEAVKRTGPARPREKSYEQKLWEAHLAAGVGGDDFSQDAQQPGTRAAVGYAASGCVLPPTIPITMQVESAGYTERGGMLNGLIVQPAMGFGMNCTVLPAGTRVTMEFWGEIGDSQMMEIGFPTFVAPGIGAIQPQSITGAPEPARNTQLPDHLSGWVLTPTLSLDAGDVVTLHLRGELNAHR